MMKQVHKFNIGIISMLERSKEIVIVTPIYFGEETESKEIEKYQFALVIKENGS